MRKITLLFVVLTLVAVAGCRRGTPSPIPASGPTVGTGQAPLPSRTASVLIQPAEGGTVALGSGAEVAMPREALSAETVVTLQATDRFPAVPFPRSAFGSAYELSLDGGNLTGMALLKLPLPPQITPDEYDLAAYRWNGRSWERAGGRLSEGSIQLGTRSPGTFAIQGTWRQASAALALALPAWEPGQETIPMAVAGQYRFSTPPMLQGDYVPARLVLKRDISGGAGQITGDISLDETVDETTLWFQPDPAQATGVIPFSHIFQVLPGKLQMPPATTGQFYAALTVEDSFAPTRQLSKAIEYTQVLPIKISGTEVVRPALTERGTQPLRWHVRLNGQTLTQVPATELALPLASVLAEGGLGEYQITLEVESGGGWKPASNEVMVSLRAPATETPEVPTTGGTLVAGPISGTETPTSDGTRPPTPTRRVPPMRLTEIAESTIASPTPLTATPTSTPVATATRPSWAQDFWADDYDIAPGDCTVLHWNVEQVIAVYLDGEPVTGDNQTRRECPPQTKTYTLKVATNAGSQEYRVTIIVQSAGQIVINFTVDNSEITKGNCTTLRWQVTNVSKVFLNYGGVKEGVKGEDTKPVCPDATTVYELQVVGTDGAITTKSLTVAVLPADRIPISFWADGYTLKPDTCTNLHWSVEGVQAVYLKENDTERGVLGKADLPVCPGVSSTYTLRATTADGREASKTLTLEATQPSLIPGEVIAQGVVRNVTGNQQDGWKLQIDGIDPLFTGTSDWRRTVVTLQVPQWLIDPTTGAGAPVDWPINAGQLVEFRAVCTDDLCDLQSGMPFYLRLRSG